MLVYQQLRIAVFVLSLMKILLYFMKILLPFMTTLELQTICLWLLKVSLKKAVLLIKYQI